MVTEQSNIAGWAVELRSGQVGFPQRGSCDRQSVDRIGFAVAARRVAGVRHQLGRHPHNRLAGGKQIGFESSRQMAAVLNRPAALRPELLGPTQQGEVILAGCADGSLAEPAAGRIDRDGGVAALVRVDSYDHHGRVSLLQLG